MPVAQNSWETMKQAFGFCGVDNEISGHRNPKFHNKVGYQSLAEGFLTQEVKPLSETYPFEQFLPKTYALLAKRWMERVFYPLRPPNQWKIYL
jgi:hypothetical protein